MDREARNFDNSKRETERAGSMSMIQGAQAIDTVANRVMDKRICQDMLFTRAGELERQAIGTRRLAELVGATSDNDYPLFMAVLALIDRR